MKLLGLGYIKELNNKIQELEEDNKQKSKAIEVMTKELDRLYSEHNKLEKFTRNYCGIECSSDNCEKCINQKIMDIIQVKNKYRKDRNDQIQTRRYS